MADDRPNPSAPTACKLWLRYAKRGKLRFASHRDLARLFERAVRKAELPVAYSQGFSPHPKLSWIGAAPTGTASEAEYVEIGLTESVDPDSIAERLGSALPADVPVLQVVTAGEGALADRMRASRWRITLPVPDGASLEDAVAALLDTEEVIVQRRTKSGLKDIDVRQACVSIKVEPVSESFPQVSGHVAKQPPGEGVPKTPGYGILEVVVRQMTPTVRPDDVLRALHVVTGHEWFGGPAKASRIAQGPLDDAGQLVDPLVGDRTSST